MMKRLVFVLFLRLVLGWSRKISIGGLFNNDDPTLREVLEISVQMANQMNHDFSYKHSNTRFDLLSHRVNKDSFDVSRKVCKLAKTGVAAIFGPADKATAGHVQSMCDTIEIPHIAALWDPDQDRGKFINLYPHADTLSMVFVEMVKEYDWTSFTVLFDSSDSLVRMSGLLKFYDPRGHTIPIMHLGEGPNYRRVLKKLKDSGEERIIIDCSDKILPEVLKQAQQVGIMSDKYKYIVTSLNLQTLNLEPYYYSGMNFTGVRMLDPEQDYVKSIYKNFLTNVKGLESPSDIRIEVALMFDAMQLFAKAFKQLKDAVKGDVRSLPCNGTLSWEHGLSLNNFFRLSEMRGLSGLIRFDNDGFRSNIQLDIIKIGYSGIKKAGAWNSSMGIEWCPEINVTEPVAEQTLKNKTFIVLISLTKPYGMLRETTKSMKDNERFEGFGIDVIQELSNMLGFNYTFQVQADYGSYNPKTKKWNGMFRELMDGNAHLAITDLTITSERESVVDFTMPFMNLGISILYKKPRKAPPSLFSFLSPFANDVWLRLVLAWIFVSLLFYITGRLSAMEWKNPYPCIEEPLQLENQFTLNNSLWFTIAAFMQQGSEIAPTGLPTRILASTWWFFCIIVVSSYTANLAAFLTVETPVKLIKNVEDLANQNVIKYGAKRDGATFNFFRDSNHSTYQKMYKYMMANIDDMPDDNDKGVEKVLKENYAFLMESSSIEYLQERECSISQVGGLLDNKGYGIAMKKHSPYRNDLSTAVLKLQETGVLTKLKKKWWKEKRGGGKCQVDGSSGQVAELNLDNVGGVFFVLVLGVVVAAVMTIKALVYNVACNALKHNRSFKEDIVDELKIVVKCKETKENNRRETSARSTEESTRECTPPYGFLPAVIATTVNNH